MLSGDVSQSVIDNAHIIIDVFFRESILHLILVQMTFNILLYVVSQRRKRGTRWNASLSFSLKITECHDASIWYYPFIFLFKKKKKSTIQLRNVLIRVYEYNKRVVLSVGVRMQCTDAFCTHEFPAVILPRVKAAFRAKRNKVERRDEFHEDTSHELNFYRCYYYYCCCYRHCFCKRTTTADVNA